MQYYYVLLLKQMNSRKRKFTYIGWEIRNKKNTNNKWILKVTRKSNRKEKERGVLEMNTSNNGKAKHNIEEMILMNKKEYK